MDIEHLNRRHEKLHFHCGDNVCELMFVFKNTLYFHYFSQKNHTFQDAIKERVFFEFCTTY